MSSSASWSFNLASLDTKVLGKHTSSSLARATPFPTAACLRDRVVDSILQSRDSKARLNNHGKSGVLNVERAKDLGRVIVEGLQCDQQSATIAHNVLHLQTSQPLGTLIFAWSSRSSATRFKLKRTFKTWICTPNRLAHPPTLYPTAAARRPSPAFSLYYILHTHN
ncbi:hypothetical protein OG21DRAFT_153709 [Imleria badia]|nr:hypothetical protein OG21DRAFT_153709 [Imleria badia]